jgi:hypothetical protein
MPVSRAMPMCRADVHWPAGREMPVSRADTQGELPRGSRPRETPASRAVRRRTGKTRRRGGTWDGTETPASRTGDAGQPGGDTGRTAAGKPSAGDAGQQGGPTQDGEDPTSRRHLGRHGDAGQQDGRRWSAGRTHRANCRGEAARGRHRPTVSRAVRRRTGKTRRRGGCQKSSYGGVHKRGG